MDASIILQTELLCVPTQWLFVDMTRDHRVKGWISPLDKTNAIDYLTFQHEELSSNNPKEFKKLYKASRPNFLEQFGGLYDKSIKDGTRGRLAVWFIGDLDDEWSAALLSELPLDLANYCYWKQKYLPVVVRVGIGSQTASNTFLRQLSAQYFDMPAFDVKYETKPDHVLGVYSNPYDTCCIVSTDQPLIELLSKLIPLHLVETQFAKRYRNDTLGSGGQLYVVEEMLVSSVSHFRRIDWLVLAQVEYCPRLWQLDKQNIFDEFQNLLDYRHWKGRFKQLSDNDTDYSKIIDLSRTSAEDTMIRRRKREKNWDSVLTDDKKRHVAYDATLLEDNVFRITSTDMNSFKELILCLQRQTRWKESLKWLDLIQKRKKYPHVFIKLKGVSLLKSGDEVEGRKWLAKYRSAILSEYEDSVLLGSPMSVADQAATYSEVAAVALVEGDSNVALEYAVKALLLNKKLVQAYKTLTWASCESGKGDWSSEELVFSFFVSYLKNPSMGEQYYTKVTENFPNNPHYRYYYAIFLSLVLNDRERAEQMFQESLKSFGDHPRVLESYATFLFQQGHHDTAEIEQLYRKALKAEPDNLIITANMAAFLLANDPKKNMEEGLTMIDRVLFSSGILEREPDLALECWFYALIYKPLDRYYESLKGVKLAYRTGARAHGWDFSMHFAYAETIKHPDLHWIKILADVLTNQCTIERLQGWSAWWTAKTDRIFESKSTAVTRPAPASTSTASSATTTATINKKKVFPTAYSRQSKQTNTAKPAVVVVNDENRRENMKASTGADASDDGPSTPPLSPTTKQLTQTITRRSSSNNTNNSMRTPPGSPLAFRLPSPVAKKGSAGRSVARSKSSLDFTVDQLANNDTAGLKLSASKEISAFDFSPQVGKDSKKRKLSESREGDKTALKDSQTRASKVAKYSKDQSPSESPRSASSMDSPMKLDLSSMDSPTSPLSPRRSPRTRKTSASDPSPFDFPDDNPPVARKLPLSPGKPVAPSGTNVKRNNVKLDLVNEPVHTKVDLTAADGTTSPVSSGFKPILPSSPPRSGKVYSRRK
jgi:tetratricopeptide (TPR) repeat protein